MKLFLLGVVLFGLSLSSCYADTPPTLLELMHNKQIDIVRQRDIVCESRRPNHMYGAKRRAVQKNYESVWEHGGYLTVKSKKTSRISCKRGAGIFVINETEEDKNVSYAQVADIAREIALTCYDVYSKINGELKDKKEGFVVLVSKADCGHLI